MLSKYGYRRGLLVPRVDRQSLRGAAILATKVSLTVPGRVIDNQRKYSSLCFKVNPPGKATRQLHTFRTLQNRTQRPKISDQAACSSVRCAKAEPRLVKIYHTIALIVPFINASAC